MFTNPYASFAAPKAAFNFNPTVQSQSTVMKTAEEIEAENKKLERKVEREKELKRGEQLPNHITVGITAAQGDLRNRNDAGAVSNGIITCEVLRIHKKGNIYFETGDGDIVETQVKVGQLVALKLPTAKATRLVDKFQEFAPSIGNSRAASLRIAFGDEVYANSESTLEIEDPILMGELTPGISRPPASKEAYEQKRDEKIEASVSYRATKREEYRAKDEAERLAQLAAAMGVKLPPSQTEAETEADAPEEEYTADKTV